MSALTPEAGHLKTACDLFVAAAPDPNAAMAAIVQVWALGGMAGEDLLDDLEHLAVGAALARGTELTAPELLDSFGQHQRAQRIRNAVEAGRARHLEAAKRACMTTSLAEISRVRGEDNQIVDALLQQEETWAGWPGGAPHA